MFRSIGWLGMWMMLVVVLAGCGPSAEEIRLKELAAAEAEYKAAFEKLSTLDDEQVYAEGEFRQAQVFVENAQRLGDQARVQSAQKVLNDLHEKYDARLAQLEVAIAEQKQRVEAARAKRDALSGNVTIPSDRVPDTNSHDG